MCEMRPSTCIYVNCLNRLRFSAEVSTKLEAMYFFRQFKCHKQKGNMEATQMTSLFSIYFIVADHFWTQNGQFSPKMGIFGVKINTVFILVHRYENLFFLKKQQHIFNLPIFALLHFLKYEENP